MGAAFVAASLGAIGCDPASAGAEDTASADASTSADTADTSQAASDAAASDADFGDTMAPDDSATLGDAVTPSDTGAGADTQATDTPDTTVGSSCPPSGPYGTAVGDALADLTLLDCDGNPHHIADLCGRPASLMTAFAGWCPVCQGHAAEANADYLQFKAADADFEWLFVITDTDAANAMTPAYCRAIRDDYGLTMPVLIDTDGVFPGHIGVTSTNAWTVALDAEGIILAKDKYDQTNAFAKVNAALK